MVYTFYQVKVESIKSRFDGKIIKGMMDIQLVTELKDSLHNYDGGLAIERRDSFTVEGLTDKQIVKYQKDFWSTLNDRNKVSKNILLNHHVRPVIVGEKKILRIDVPAADRHDKPVYIGTDPMKGTYKRDYEGDFLCTEEAVRAMFADQRDVSGDVEVLEEFGLDVLNQDTIKGYRIIFEQLHSGHPWNAMIKQYAGYSGHILTKGIGAAIYTTFSVRCVQEWTMI